MLSPFKTFLSNLQKNAIGATIFGLSPNMTSLDEPETDSAALFESDPHPENDPLVDPLADPLALDDILSNEESNSVPIIEPELESTADDRVILVDVNLLKKPAENVVNVSETEADDSYETTTIDIGETGEEGVRSDGSDSGLGSEQSTILSSVDILPVNSDLVITKSNLKRRSDSELHESAVKRPKRNIQFEGVTVYYFPRTQGFTCVPSQGGCTLGMGSHHIHIKSFTLTEHAAEQRRVHRQQLQELHPNGSSTEETDSDEEQSENSGSELDTESSGFLQPVNARQRRILLRAVGIRKIDSIEKDDCRTIRTSREFCGCNCRGYCDPDTCSCSQNGIKCQVDRPNFPCGCTRDGCGNVYGRVEFNPGRVRTHFIHTIMRLELEKKQNRTEDQSFNNQGNLDWNHQSNCLQNIGLDNMTHYTNIYNSSNNTNMTAGVVGSQGTCTVNMNPTGGVHNLMELNQMRTSGTDSLDLHYAYRDEYSSGMSHANGDSPRSDIRSESMHKIYEQHAGSSTNENCTYTGFNGHENYSNYHQPQYTQSHSHDESLIASTCSTFAQYQNETAEEVPVASSSSLSSSSDLSELKTNDELIKSETNSNDLIEVKKDLVNLLPPAANSSEIHAINDLLENNRNAPAAPAATIVAVSQQPADSSLTEYIEPITTTQSNDEPLDKGLKIIESTVDCPKDTIEMNENLSEVIKKSIVETSSA